MPWWVFTRRPGWLDDLKRFVDRLGGVVERVFIETKRNGWTALADLLVEAESLDGALSVIVLDPEDLAEEEVARRIVLHEFRLHHIRVFDLKQLKQVTASEMELVLGKAVEAGLPAWQIAFSWWLGQCNLTKDTTQPIYASVAWVIGVWQEFQNSLRAARVRRLPNRDQRRRVGRVAYGEAENEKAVVQRILALRKAGKGYTAIANKLNEEGHRTLTGKPFRPQTVKNYVLRYGGEGKGDTAEGGR